MTVHEAIRARRSVRKYQQGAEIPAADIEKILEAAMCAPSAHNARPWHFLVIGKRETLDAIRANHPYSAMLESASCAIMVCTPAEDDTTPAHSAFYQQDCAAATQNLMLEALELGYGTCWCGVFPKMPLVHRLQEVLNTKLTPYCMVALGVPDENPKQRGFLDKERIHYI